MRTLFTSILLLAVICVYSQYTLILDKPGKRKRIKYNVGGMVHFELKNGTRYGGKLKVIYRSSFLVGEQWIEISQVAKVLDPSNRVFHQATAGKALVGAATTAMYAIANNVFNEDKGPVLDQAAINVTAFFLIVGAIMLPMRNKKYGIGKWRLRALDLRPG